MGEFSRPRAARSNRLRGGCALASLCPPASPPLRDPRSALVRGGPRRPRFVAQLQHEARLAEIDNEEAG